MGAGDWIGGVTREEEDKERAIRENEAERREAAVGPTARGWGWMDLG